MRDSFLYTPFNIYSNDGNSCSYELNNYPVYKDTSTGVKYKYDFYFPDIDGFTKTMIKNNTNGYDVTYTLTVEENNKSYVYTNGTWKEVQAYVYTNGGWREAEPNIF